MYSRRGCPLLEAFVLLSAVLVICDGQSITLVPSSDQSFSLEPVGLVAFVPQWFNVTCERNGVALAGAEVMWTRNGGEINVTDGHRISGNMLAFRIHHTHMLRQVIKCSAVGSDNNTYAASVGFVSSAGIPRPNVIVKSIRPTTVVLTVTSSRLAKGDTLEVVNGQRTQRLLASAEEVTLSSLSPGTGYTPSFAYIRGVEKGPSVPIQVTTRQVPATPVSLSVSGILPDSAVLSWTELRSDQWHGDGRVYNIIVSSENSIQDDQEYQATSPPHTITGLRADEAYHVSIVANNSIDTGNAATMTFSTLAVPLITQVLSVRGSFVNSNKDFTRYTFTAIFRYSVAFDVDFKYSLTGANGVFTTVRSHSPKLNLIIGGHKHVVVNAFPIVNDVAVPEYGNTHSFVTPSTKPTPPVVRLTPGGDYIDVSWDKLDSQGETTVVVIRTTNVATADVTTIPVTGEAMRTMSQRLTGLSGATEYSVQLSLENERSESIGSASSFTLNGVPSQVMGFTHVGESYVVGARWSAFNGWNSRQTGGREFRVCLKKASAIVECSNRPSTDVGHTFTRVERDTVYTVTIAARNTEGFGPESTFTARTSADSIITDIGYVLGAFTTSTRDETTATFTAVFANVQYGVEYNYSINGVLNTSRSLVLKVVVGGHKKVVVQASPVVNGVVLHGYGSSRTLTTAAFHPTPAVFTVDPGVHYVDVKWNDVDSQGATTTIEITVTAVGSGKVIEVNPFANTNYSSSVKEYRVEGLDPGSKYTVLVKVSNEERMQRGGSPVRFDTLAAAPEPIQGISAAANSSHITVSWPPITDAKWNTVDVTSRSLRICISAPRTLCESLNADDTSFVFDGLSPFTTYNITVTARNEIGSTEETLSKITGAAAPSKVRNVKAELDDTDFSRATVSWTVPKHPRGIISYYRLYIFVLGRQDVLQEVTTQETRITFIELSGYTEYYVTVEAYTVEYSHPRNVTFRTNIGVPDAPRNLAVQVGVEGGTLNLSWLSPINTNGPIISYTIYYVAPNGASKNRTINASDANSVKHLLDGLEYEVQYEVRISASTTAGESEKSIAASAKTLPGEPQPPLNLTVVSVDMSSITIEWFPPEETFGSTRSYLVTYRRDELNAESTNVVETNVVIESTVTNTDSLSYTAQRLFPYTRYYIGVQTLNSRTKSISSYVYNATLEGVPDPPRALMVACPEKNAQDKTNVSWQEPRRLNGPGVVYRLRFWARETVTNGYLNETLVEEFPGLRWSPEKPIQPYTEYTVSVEARQSTALELIGRSMTYASYICTPAKYVPQPHTPVVPPASTNITNGRVQIKLTPPPEIFAKYVFVMVEEENLNTRQRRMAGSRFRRAAVSSRVAAILGRREIADLPNGAFVVGDGQTYNGRINSQLKKGYAYRIGTAVGLTITSDEDNTLSPTTFSTGRFEYSEQQPETDQNTVIIAAAVGGVVVVILVVVLVILVARCYSKKKPESETSTAPRDDFVKTKPFDVPIQTHFLSPTGDPIEELRACGNKALEARPPVPIALFSQHVAKLREDGCIKFSEDYASLPLQYEGYTTNNSDMSINHMKNRYTNIKAFDHSRVLLNAVRGTAGSDYINANYIDGHNEKNAYIATQGPVEQTKPDFWRMVWEQRSATIVMLTNLEENGKPKCSQYWPDSGTVAYGGIEVTLTDNIPLADYVVRIFSLAKVGREEAPREVKQFQFTAWPDQSAPRHATPMLLFRRKVRQLTPDHSGPMIVHCSAGIGRTGTFIAIDAMLNRAESMDTLDVYGYCTVMRTQRNYMVQVEEQYFFIHDALKESLECGNTEILAKDLPAAIKSLHQPSLTDDTVTAIEAEYQRLSLHKVDHLNFLAAMRDCNVKKNRFVEELYLPFDEYRVRLPLSTKLEAGGDYINASYIDGYKSHNAFIAAESPLARTVDSFWEMVWQTGSKVIVMLADTEENGQEVCYQYWPTDMACQYGKCLVDPISEQTKTDASQQVVYSLRQFKMTNTAGDATRTVCLFQYTGRNCWPGDQEYRIDSPALATGRRSLIDLIGEVQKLQERTDDHSPVVIHCNTGVGRTGCFVALSTIIERMRCEGLLDVFMTVKNVRTHRPFMVRTLAEYCFVYDTVLEYLSPFDHFTDVMEADVGEVADMDGDGVGQTRYSVDVTV